MGGKASVSSKNAWNSRNYDRINLTLPKGKKGVIQAHAQSMGESVNAFIARSIDAQIVRDCSEDE